MQELGDFVAQVVLIIDEGIENLGFSVEGDDIVIGYGSRN